MPTLNWIGKDAVVDHHKQVPFRLLKPIDKLSVGDDWAAKIKRRRHIGDFSSWKEKSSYQKAFDRLLRDLKAMGGRVNGE
jgi:hypothetical protein